jgi:hypothetical protein
VSEDKSKQLLISLESNGTPNFKAQTCIFRGLMRSVEGESRITVVCPSGHCSSKDLLRVRLFIGHLSFII